MKSSTILSGGGVTTAVPATGAAGDSSNHPLMKSSAILSGGVTTAVPATGAVGDSSNISPIYSSLSDSPGGDTTKEPVTGGFKTVGHDVRSISTFIPSSDHPTVVLDLLKELYAASVKGLNPEQSAKLPDLLSDYFDVFATHDGDLGLFTFTSIKHKKYIRGAKPIRQPMRRAPLGFEQEERKHLQSMLDGDIIQPSVSDWASPPVLVRKKDGGVRWCIDYRAFNSVTIKDAFPLPRIEECLDTLANATYLSTLDLASGYWQLEINEEDRHKTAFVTRYGLFEHIRLGFGLCNAPATFRRAMHTVLQGLLWDYVLAYLDDVIVVGHDFDLILILLTFQKCSSVSGNTNWN